jgi:hypothetical protein
MVAKEAAILNNGGNPTIIFHRRDRRGRIKTQILKLSNPDFLNIFGLILLGALCVLCGECFEGL